MFKTIGLMKGTALAGAALVLGLGLTGAFAQNTVKIGAVYPLSGNAASAGASAKAAIEVAVDVI
ncbi:MAG: hypothetical protein EBS72_14045, partial [Rhizobiales bacterium]|nr:hypothetical protein [Hyphomicrobiales bacterium]